MWALNLQGCWKTTMQKKNALSKARSHRNLDGDADEWILHLGPTTKWKQAPRTKVAPKATTSKKTTTKEENEDDGECEVLKNWKSNVEALIALRGDIKLGFVKNVKK